MQKAISAQDILQQGISANQSLVNQMNFSDAIKYSLEHNNNIRAMRKGLSVTEREIGIARSVMMPKVRLYENFAATNNPTETLSYRLNQARATTYDLELNTLNHPPSVTNFLTSGVVEQTIYNRRAMIEIKMAKKNYSANGYFYLRKQEDLINQVAQAYLMVAMDKELVKISEQAVIDVKEHLKIAETRYKSKTGLLSDMLRAKTAVEDREEKLISAKRDLDVAKRNLGLLLGLESSVETSDSIPEIELKDINYYQGFAIYRNDIKATEIKLENAKNNVNAAKALWYPTMNALASYNFNNNSFPFGGEGSNYIVGVILKWDAFDGNKRKYEILQAKDKDAEAKEYLEGIRKAVNFKVYETYSNVQEHQKILDLATVAKKEAEDDMKLVAQRWKESVLPFVALVDAQNNLDNARANVVKNQKDLKEDLINLSFESGIIYQELFLN